MPSNSLGASCGVRSVLQVVGESSHCFGGRNSAALPGLVVVVLLVLVVLLLLCKATGDSRASRDDTEGAGDADGWGWWLLCLAHALRRHDCRKHRREHCRRGQRCTGQVMVVGWQLGCVR